MRTKIIIFFLITGFSVVPNARAQVIKLKSGHSIEGKIIKQTHEYIVVDQGLGDPVTYYMDVDKELPPEAPVSSSLSAESTSSAQIYDGPLPTIPYDTSNPNISETELKKTIEVFQLALNSRNGNDLKNFVAKDTKFYSSLENYKSNYSGEYFINLIKTERATGNTDSYEIAIDQFSLDGPRAITEETIRKKKGITIIQTFRQRNVYLKFNGSVQLTSSETIME